MMTIITINVIIINFIVVIVIVIHIHHVWTVVEWTERILLVFLTSLSLTVVYHMFLFHLA